MVEKLTSLSHNKRPVGEIIHNKRYVSRIVLNNQVIYKRDKYYLELEKSKVKVYLNQFNDYHNTNRLLTNTTYKVD